MRLTVLTYIPKSLRWFVQVEGGGLLFAVLSVRSVACVTSYDRVLVVAPKTGSAASITSLSTIICYVILVWS